MKCMSRAKFRNLFPTHILFMILCIIFFSIIIYSDGASLSAREQGLTKALIYVLAVIITMHFILRALWQLYLSKKVSSFAQPQNSLADEISSNNIPEQSAPLGYRLEVAEQQGFSFCYPKNWQIIRSKENLLYMQIKEPNLEQGMTFLRNFNVSYQNIEGVNTDFLFKAIISGLMKAIGAALEFKEPFKTEETFGMRYKLKYNSPKRTDLCCYQVAITNNTKKGLLLITFTAGTQDFPKTKKLFDDIAGLVKIF